MKLILMNFGAFDRSCATLSMCWNCRLRVGSRIVGSIIRIVYRRVLEGGISSLNTWNGKRGLYLIYAMNIMLTKGFHFVLNTC